MILISNPKSKIKDIMKDRLKSSYIKLKTLNVRVIGGSNIKNIRKEWKMSQYINSLFNNFNKFEPRANKTQAKENFKAKFKKIK